MSGSAIEIEALEFAWPRAAALLAIEHLSVPRGASVFLRGASGSGKSTLLSLIAGVLEPCAGRVRVLGTDVSELDAGERDRFRGERIGLIFQMFNLVPYLNVRDNVLLPLRFSKGRRARLGSVQPDDEARRLLGALGLTDPHLLGRSPTQLSIGQQQRVAAARALIGKPELLIADEPTSALDADTRAEFLQLLKRECSAGGTTLLFVSHDQSLATLFDRCLTMEDVNGRALPTM